MRWTTHRTQEVLAARYGPEIHEFFGRLDVLVADRQREWGLRGLHPLEGGTTSVVLAGHDDDGAEVVLKVPVRPGAAEREAAEKDRIAREKADAEAKEAARLKAESERPQREKLHRIADAVLRLSQDVPTGPGCGLVCGVLHDAIDRIREIANGPLV